DSDRYAAFLVLLSRLQLNSRKLEAGSGGFPVQFMMLDDGVLLGIRVPAKKGETAQQAVARLQAAVAEILAGKFDKTEVVWVKNNLGLMLGLKELPDQFIGNNPYGAAFSLGRREQLGLDSAQLGKALDALSDDDVRRTVKEVFGPDRSVGV